MDFAAIKRFFSRVSPDTWIGLLTTIIGSTVVVTYAKSIYDFVFSGTYVNIVVLVETTVALVLGVWLIIIYRKLRKNLKRLSKCQIDLDEQKETIGKLNIAFTETEEDLARKNEEISRYRNVENKFELIASKNAIADYQIFQHLFIDVCEIIEYEPQAVQLLKDSGKFPRILLQFEHVRSTIIRDHIGYTLDHLTDIIENLSGFRCRASIKMYTGAETLVGGSGIPEIERVFTDGMPDRGQGIKQLCNETPFKMIEETGASSYINGDILKATGYIDKDLQNFAGNYNSIIIVAIRHPAKKNSRLGFLQIDSTQGDITSKSSLHYATEIAVRLSVMLARFYALDKKVELYTAPTNVQMPATSTSMLEATSTTVKSTGQGPQSKLSGKQPQKR